MDVKDTTIMGIDPGTNLLGFGVIRVVGKKVSYIDMGVIDMRKEKDHYSKLKKLSLEIETLIDFFSPDILSLESPFCGKNPQVLLKLGRAQGVVMSAAMRRGIDVAEYAPRKAKIAITGAGAASKEQVALMIRRTLDIEIKPEHLDATDALAIALCHYYQLISPLSSVKASSDWKKFLEANPDRVTGF